MEAARMLMVWFQDPDSLSSGNSRLLMIFVGVVALSMLTQAIVFVVAAIGAAKVRNRMLGIVEELRLKTLPVIDSAQGMVHELHPKLRTITDNLAETSHVVRAKATEFDSTLSNFNQTLNEVNHKTRAQAARVDGMVSSVLDSTQHVASTVQRGVQTPVREISGLMAGLKAGVDTFFNGWSWRGSRAKAGNGVRDPFKVDDERAAAYEAYKPSARAYPDDDIGY